MNSRAKGANFERKVAKILTEKLGVEFKRTPQSGAFSTNNNYVELAGDLYCADKDFPYVIECKKYKEYQLEDLLTGSSVGIYKWILQLEKEKKGKLGLLIFQKDYGKIFAAIEGIYPRHNTMIWKNYTIGLLDIIIEIIKERRL